MLNILKSPVFILCCILFILHQLLQKGLGLQIPLANQYLDNLLAMPIILTFLLLEKQLLFKKGAQYRLTIMEIVIATLFIAFVAEWVFPSLSSEFTGDWKDLVLYSFGALLFYFTINRKPQKG